MALVAVLLQLYGEVVGADLPSRTHSTRFYALVAVLGLPAVVLLVVVLSRLTRCWARRTWQPEVVELQRELYERINFILSNDG